jgi:two-component system sensor histidine kinase DevS
MAEAPSSLSPARVLLAAALFCIALCAVAISARLGQPSLGLVLVGNPKGDVVDIAIVRGPSAAANVPAPASLVSVADGERSLKLVPGDVIEEPDYFDTYAEMTTMFARQSELVGILAANEVTLTVRKENEAPQIFRVRPRRASLGDLPGIFWFQLVAASAALLISVWAFVLRPRELGVQLFAFIGATIPIFIVPAAIYGTRELAMDGRTMRVLSSVNHIGANLFGLGLVWFFLSYPKRLVSRRGLAVVAAVVVLWVLADVFRLAPDQNTGSRAPIFLEMIGAIVLGFVQWRATRGDPRGRAGLRWLGVSVLLGSGTFVFSVVGSTVLGLFPPLAQGYTFGFFLLMHASFALGLSRHRLFDLDGWAYTLLFWVLAGLGLLAVDIVLVSVLEANRALSLGGILLVFGFVYLPLRTWLWSKIVSRKATPEHEIFDAVLLVTFAKDDDERAKRWKDLLGKLFDPTELRAVSSDDSPPRSTVLEDGLVLEVPRVADLPPMRLAYPWKGRGLFASRHEKLADQLVALLRQAENRREAFERGVRDERARIARDMHDDVGAGLLSSLHRDGLDATRDAIRQAIGDVRSIVHELTARQLELGDLLAEMRHETIQRLEQANVDVEWPIHKPKPGLVMPHGAYRHVSSIIRELTSNVIRHSGAKHAKVLIDTTGDRLVVEYSDDGRGFDPKSVRRGSGLDNLERRAATLGGSLTFTREGDRTVARLDVPVSEPGRAETSPP